LLDRPELAGWFLDPASVQADAVDLLASRESRLVLSDQLKAEREEAIVSRVIEREIDDAGRRLWARRLGEMSLVLDAAGEAAPATSWASTICVPSTWPPPSTPSCSAAAAGSARRRWPASCATSRSTAPARASAAS